MSKSLTLTPERAAACCPPLAHEPLTMQQAEQEAGLLDRDKRGVWVYYRARPEAMRALSRLVAPEDTPAEHATAGHVLAESAAAR